MVMGYISDREKENFADAAIEVIRDHLTVDEVFTGDEISQYVHDNPKVFDPSYLFEDDQLRDWAKANGFVEAE
jgi:hypothetical protein